ncbi:MAG: DUF5777 family beta-barrel protein [Bacteroidales bacterium]
MKKYKLIVIMLCWGIFMASGIASAQEDTTAVTQEPTTESNEDEGKLPVRNPWTTGILIDNQTTEAPNAGQLEFVIHHRFGKIEEISNLYGIYASSNIRLGVNYGITEKISVGFGTEKDHMMQEFTGKYKIISQSRDGKIPVSVTYFGNIVIDSREKETFGVNYEFLNRLSFFNQVIVGRKLTNAISVQVAGSYSHFNAVTETTLNAEGTDTIGLWKNDYAGLMVGGRAKFHNNMSFIFEYSMPIAINEIWEGQNEPKSSLGLGLEIGTSTHAFQIFAAQYRGIIAQQNYARNLNSISDGDWAFGFNITVRF